jgi:hypothetical protein
MQFHFYCIDGSNVSTTVIGEAMDSGDKATNKAMSIALKYALLQALLIPTEDEKDPDLKTLEPLKPSKNEAPATTTQQTEKEWLNPGTDKWNEAVKFLKEGGDIKKIRSKYNIGTKNHAALLEQSKK